MYRGIREYIDRDDLLNRISQEQVFLQFLGIYPEVGHKRFLSPFRTDKKPGCRFEWRDGMLYFIDNARFNNRLFWNIFHVVMHLYSCNFQRACQIIAEGNNVVGNTFNKKVVAKFRPEIRFEFEPWLDDNLFGLTNDELISECVYKVTNYYIRTQSGWSKNSLHNPKETLCIAYHFPDSDNVKLYFPEQKDDRWYSNCNTSDIFGLHKVDYYSSYSDLLIITKSQKDRLMLDYKLEYPAIAFQNEGCYIPQYIMDELKLKFNTIIIIYDNDWTGYSQAQKLSEKYDIEYRIIECDKKDIYEMLEYGVNNIKSLLDGYINDTFD